MSELVRPFSLKDKQRVREVVLAGLKAYGFDFSPEFDFDLDDPVAHYIKTGGMFLVMDVGGKVIGTIAVINKGSVAELKRLYVDEAYQGRGFGSKLLDAAIRFCEDQSFSKIEFETNKRFRKAHQLYFTRGFQVVREDENSLYMAKDLVQAG